MEKVGVWVIGIYGSVSSAVIGGALNLARGTLPPTGLITGMDSMSEAGFVPFSNLLFAGHDIRRGSIRESFRSLLAQAHVEHGSFLNVENELGEIEKEVRGGTAIGCGQGIRAIADDAAEPETVTLSETVERIASDITSFRKRRNLSTVIVVNLSSTEPPVPAGPHAASVKAFESAIEKDEKSLMRASLVYAYAAFKAGCPYINFTASTGAAIPALMELAERKRLPHCGRDGKTGETLVKSVLGGIFKYRALKVLSWQGYNILGNLDGKVLSDPASRSSKTATKESVLPSILGYAPHSHVSIDYVPSLGEWKVAWDFIHFEGFLGTKMSMQFIWQGCDSILAAPLVLDLIRLVELSQRRGETGALAHLALFFKQPLGTEANDLHTQWHMLEQYIERVKKEKPK